MKGKVPTLRLKNVAYSVGLFNDTLPSFLTSVSDKAAAFLHIDVDLYSSARDVLCAFEKHGMLRHGSVIVFDELIGYPEFKQGEMKAFHECVVKKGYAYGVIDRGAKVVTDEYVKEVWPQSVSLFVEGNREG